MRYMRYLTAILLVIAGTPVKSDYILRSGDVISLSVVGHESLTDLLMIGMDGKISIPLIGTLSADGLSLEDLQSNIRQLFSKAAYSTTDFSGNEVWRTVTPNVVMIDVDTYRPIYIFGDVASPGPVGFRPGMSLIQGIASAGGIGAIADLTPASRKRQVVSLQGQAEVIRESIDQNQNELQRLRSEVDLIQDDKEIDADVNEWSSARATARSIRRQSNEATIKQLNERREILRKQLEGAEQSVEIDSAEVKRSEELIDRGLIAQGRLADARQALLLSNSRALDIGSELGDVEVELSRIRLSDDVLETEEAADIFRQVNDINTNLEIQRQELNAVLNQISILGYSVVPEEAEFEIMRETEGENQTITPELTSRLEPGDVVKVTIPGLN